MLLFKCFPGIQKSHIRKRFIGDAYRSELPVGVLQCWRSENVFVLQCCSALCLSTVSLEFKSRNLAGALQGLLPLFAFLMFPWHSKVASKKTQQKGRERKALIMPKEAPVHYTMRFAECTIHKQPIATTNTISFKEENQGKSV